jgi:hypothetical protein
VTNSAYVPFSASTQIKIQLRSFAEMVAKQIVQQKRAALEQMAASSSGAGARRGMTASSAAELVDSIKRVGGRNAEDLVGTEIKGGMDTTIGGIVRRVVLLVLALAVLGVVLFYAGLYYLFPTDI